MSTPSKLIDLHTGLVHSGLTAHEHLGFELGWDHAHHGVELPLPYSQEASPLRHGFVAGRAAFGARALVPNRHVRKWLQLRLHAWLRGRSVELVQVTPNYLQQIEASHCPITRAPMSGATFASSDASIDRVRNDAGYAAGNLAMMSAKANHAKAAWGFADARRFAQQVEAEGLPGLGGLSAAQWWRVATLCSFVQAMPHEQACELPLRILPPNRLRLFNPVQALQVFVSQQLLKPGWSQRLSRFEDLLPGTTLRRDFKSFFMTLLPRVIEAGAGRNPAGSACANADAAFARWAVEDAWCASLVQQRWARFARQLDADQCQALLARAVAKQLATGAVLELTEAGATDGWNLPTRGYVPHVADVPVAFAAAGEGRQRHLAW